MRCPFCAGPIPLPPPSSPAVCVPCDRQFPLIADLGFFTYTVEVYAAEP
jgi:hypothetical protein